MRKNPNDEQALNHSVDYFKECIPIFIALSDLNRQKIVLELAKHDRLNVSQLDLQINLSRPAISHHLKTLKQAGIVNSEKQGTENYYFLTIKNTVDLLKAAITAIEDSCYLR